MAHPDITIAGASFETVPAIVVPRTDSGNASFYDMSDTLSWLGGRVELVKELEPLTKKLSETDFASWTPSTTAKDILATETAGSFTANFSSAEEYYILWECTLPIVTDESATKKALPLFAVSSQVQAIYKRPSTWANIGARNFNGNVCSSLATGTFLRYYGATTGTVTYTWATSYGFYFTLTAATFSSTTTANPTVTVKTPKVTARCSTTYMSTANAALIDQEETVITIKAKIYRSQTRGVFRGNYDNVINLIEGM